MSSSISLTYFDAFIYNDMSALCLQSLVPVHGAVAAVPSAHAQSVAVAHRGRTEARRLQERKRRDQRTARSPGPKGKREREVER